MGHDVIVIGASAGGIEALSNLLGQLPADLPAAVLLVQHISATSKGLLPAVLGRSSRLPVKLAEDGEGIRHGRVYVAPPDQHLLVKPGTLRLSRGPRENRSRPAIDPLFRSAAVAYGPRVAGVLLTGLLDDGSAGLLAVRRCAGVIIVQDPSDALYPDMPRSALEHVGDADYVLPLVRMGAVLERLIRVPIEEHFTVPNDLVLENRIAEDPKSDIPREETLGELVAYSCPECGGPLWQLKDKHMDRFRCHVGHGFSARSLLAEQSESIERALWAAMRAIEERAKLYASLARQARERNHQRSAGMYEEQAQESHEYARQLRMLLTGGTESTHRLKDPTAALSPQDRPV